LLSSDIRGLEDLYRANGFEQVKITSKVIDDYQGHENDLALMISVDEGPQTLVGTFHIEGNHSFSEAQLGAHINTATVSRFPNSISPRTRQSSQLLLQPRISSGKF